MLLELFESLVIAIVGAMGLLIILVGIGLKNKWKLTYYLKTLVFVIVSVPAIFMAAQYFWVGPRYNYTVKAEKYSEIQRFLENKPRKPIIPEDSEKIEVYHTMPYWSAKYVANEQVWQKFQMVWQKKVGLRVKEKTELSYYRPNYVVGLEVGDVQFDELYETPVASNGAVFYVYRDSKSGKCFSFLNRW